MLFTVQYILKKTVAVIFPARIGSVNIQQKTTDKDKQGRKGQSHCKYELYSVPQINIKVKYCFAFNSARLHPGIFLSVYNRKLSYPTKLPSHLWLEAGQVTNRSWVSPIQVLWQEYNVLLEANLSAFGRGGKAQGSDSEELSAPQGTAGTVCLGTVRDFNSRFNLTGLNGLQPSLGMSPFASRESPGWCRNLCKQDPAGTSLEHVWLETQEQLWYFQPECEHLPPARYYM